MKQNLMKKSILLLLVFFTVPIISAQEMDCDQKVKKLLIEKIKSFNSKDLVPYYAEKENKWGYMHRVSKKIITKPIMKDPYFFKPEIHFYYCFDTNGLENGCSGRIMGSKDKYRIESLKNAEYQVYDVAYGGNEETKRTYKSKIKDAINGFEVDTEGRLTYFNSKFYNKEKDEPFITQVLSFKDKFYGITKTTEDKKEYYTVINQDGTEFPGFKKLEYYPVLKQTYSDDKDLWFLIKSNEGKYFYKSLFENKSLDYAIDDSTVYGENQTQSFGYVIFSMNDKKGLFDLTTMSWRIEPSDKNDFSSLFYASAEPLSYNYDKTDFNYSTDVTISSEMIKENRAKSYIYIQSSKDYFYDLNLNSYKPKK